MAEPIRTPPSAAARRAIDVLATALPPDDDVVMSGIGIDATELFGRHYDAHGGNIVSLTSQIIGDGSPSNDNQLKRSLPSPSDRVMQSSPPRKRSALSSNRPTPRRAVIAGLVALGSVVDPLAPRIDVHPALPVPPPRTARALPVSILDEVLEPAPAAAKTTKRTGSRTGGTTMLGLVPENEFTRMGRADHLKKTQTTLIRSLRRNCDGFALY